MGMIGQAVKNFFLDVHVKMRILVKNLTILSADKSVKSPYAAAFGFALA